MTVEGHHRGALSRHGVVRGTRSRVVPKTLRDETDAQLSENSHVYIIWFVPLAPHRRHHIHVVEYRERQKQGAYRVLLVTYSVH